jgi:NADPH:quinone reductase-like Zn-dependent oxidoreductase
MKAIRYHSYGSPDVLRLEDVPKPAPLDNEVLIAVRAASINPYDWHFIKAPHVLRIVTGLRGPRDPRIGVDVAGTIEGIGAQVSEFKPGDDVFGVCRGSIAEYACASASDVAVKPQNVTFEEAASVSLAGLTALQGVRDKAHVQPGQQVLINGAAGGVGTFAVQIAKAFGAHVTGVCSTRNVEMVRSIGADQVIDYTQKDFAKLPAQYDAMIDCVGNRSLSACRRVLKQKGVYLVVGGPTHSLTRLLARVVATLVISRFVSQRLVMFIAKRSKEDLAVLSDLLANGKVKPVIDRQYGLTQVAEAIRYLSKGHAHGKVVITM